MKILSLCSIMGLASVVSAQTSAPNATIPPGYLKVQGNTFNRAAFGYANGRHQNLYSPSAAGTTKTPLALFSLWVRPNGFISNQVAHSYDIEIIVSAKGSKWKAPGMKSFAGNHGTDKRVFFKRAKIYFPGTGKSQVLPHPWGTSFKSKSPFIVPQGEGLVIDVKSYSKKVSYINWFADSVYDHYRGSVISFGKGCPSNFTSSSGYNYVDAQLPWNIKGRTHALGDITFTWLGTMRTNIPVLPKSGCNLFTLPLVVHPKLVTTVSKEGFTGWFWGRIPASMVGKKLVSQVGAITPKGQLKLSHGLEVEFGPGQKSASPILSVYSMAFGPWGSFDPDKGPPRFGPVRSVTIFGRN